MNKPYYERKYGDGEMGYCDNPECYCHSNIIAEDVWVPRVNDKLRYTHDPKQSLRFPENTVDAVNNSGE